MDEEYNSIAFRREAVRFIGEMNNFISFCTKELKIDAVDWHVYSCVMYYSAKNGNMFEYHDPHFDKNTEFNHGAINAKSIYLTLGMPRETVRKRLVFLETVGVIGKDDNGYVLKSVNDFVHLGKNGLAKPYLNIQTYLLNVMKRGWDRRITRLNLNDPFPITDIGRIGFRQEAVHIANTYLLASVFCMKELSIDTLDLHVLLPVYINSTKSGFLFKDNASIDPNHEVGIVSSETIQDETGMARETVRRRLKYLESRGFIKKVKNGYKMVPQFGSGDHTENIRKYIFGIINREIVRVENIMGDHIKHKSELTTQSLI